jgi:tetratricopeptide (TPR) repeat protein
MSRTLKLVDKLLSRSRRLQHFGRYNDAFALLLKLTEFKELPDDAAAEVALRLAAISLRRRQFKYARRYLQVALEVQPDNARTHYLMARALDAGSKPNTRRALAHYRRALELEPGRVAWLCAYGLLLARLGRSREALASLRRAAKQASDEARLLKKIVAGLRLVNAADEARRLLLAARFRNPRDSRLLDLWKEFQFQQLRKDQEAGRPRAKPISAGPVVLPFIRLQVKSQGTRRGGKRIRKDDASGTPAPRAILRVRRPDQRHAQ